MDNLILREIPSFWTILAYTCLTLYAIHYALIYFDVAILPIQELFWNALVYVIPTPLLLNAARRDELKANDMLSQTHAAKSEALRRAFGLGGSALLSSLPNAGEAGGIGGMMRRASTNLTGSVQAATSDAPAGLGNWDNSCYQNSVLQALASIKSLPVWLRLFDNEHSTATTTNRSLQDTLTKLRNPGNNGQHIWTPAKLKNMSSWQQQDAQEYFSKIMDELDKEAVRSLAEQQNKSGLEGLVHGPEKSSTDQPHVLPVNIARNPLEGLVAQRVACTTCGFSEGFSMIPFNCLTVPLGTSFVYDLGECLDEYTKREDIEGVECRSCTLSRTQGQLRKLLPSPPARACAPDTLPTTSQTLSLPPEIRAQIAERIRAIEAALADDDFSDKTLKETCQISAKSFVSSTKTREALIGRAPQTLVVHINRSVFDELTGMQRKNYARVRYPSILDLQPWMLDTGRTSTLYRLKALVTHYGRHENGHYYCFKQHPRAVGVDDGDVPKESWWQLSDENVSPVTEEVALDQAGVFMLFYEREVIPTPFDLDLEESIVVPLPVARDDEFVNDPLESTPSAVMEEITNQQTATVLPLPVPYGDDLPSGQIIVEPAVAVAPLVDEIAARSDETVTTAEPQNEPASSAQSVVTTESDTDGEPEQIAEEQFSPMLQPTMKTPLLRTASPQYARHDLNFRTPLMRV